MAVVRHQSSSAELTAARVRKIKDESEFVRLKSSVMRGDHLHRERLEKAMGEVLLAVKQIVEASRLTNAEKSEIYQNLQSIPSIISEAKRDRTKVFHEAEATNGNGN
jgi:hypothetical protein